MRTQPYEHCSICDSLTGKAGAADDSIFWLEGAIGPLCDECHDTLQAEVLDNVGLPANAADELERLQRERDEYKTIVEGMTRSGFNGLSDIPCCKCGGPVVEFSVPNEAWNTVIRNNGPETDQEYLCVKCFALVAADRLNTAQAIVAKLPKCWRFNTDKTALVQTCPVVPGMVVWVCCSWGGADRIYNAQVCAVHTSGASDSARYFWNHEQAYDSLAAAEFAKQAMKD